MTYKIFFCLKNIQKWPYAINFYHFFQIRTQRNIFPNSEPYFKEQLKYPVYKLGSGINFYPLPDTIDEDGDIVTIDIEVQEAITATYSESPISGITFIIDDSMEPGTYYIPLTLNDGYESTTNILEVTVIRNTPPYYKKTLGPLSYRNTGT